MTNFKDIIENAGDLRDAATDYFGYQYRYVMGGYLFIYGDTNPQGFRTLVEIGDVINKLP